MSVDYEFIWIKVMKSIKIIKNFAGNENPQFFRNIPINVIQLSLLNHWYELLLILVDSNQKYFIYRHTPHTITPPFLQTNPIDVIKILFIKKFLQNVVRHRIIIFIPCPIFSFISMVNKKNSIFINDVKFLNIELKK